MWLDTPPLCKEAFCSCHLIPEHESSSTIFTRHAVQGEEGQQLILPLLVLICQLRDAIDILPDAKDIKFISGQYDFCQQSFLQVPKRYPVIKNVCSANS